MNPFMKQQQDMLRRQQAQQRRMQQMAYWDLKRSKQNKEREKGVPELKAVPKFNLQAGNRMAAGQRVEAPPASPSRWKRRLLYFFIFVVIVFLILAFMGILSL